MVNGTRYLSASDRVKEQEEVVFDYQLQVKQLIEEMELGLDKSIADFEAMITSNRITSYEFRQQATQDTYWAGASVAFVLLYFILHMRSLILATYCVLLILFSFAVTQILYVEVFKIDYFATMHNLVIFIVIGISADNVFVIYDAWK